MWHDNSVFSYRVKSYNSLIQVVRIESTVSVILLLVLTVRLSFYYELNVILYGLGFICF
ncbi:Uncharacterised protein [Salmonella enterica subsp. enterica]|uniref:Uncharacterized protein n=1 Tax=Salmonella enterica I TaxID=59201 RepID=A0A3S4G6M3_SALET|nr:Uncharacterised protein [Salmonella enterica subsp. enterica]